MASPLSEWYPPPQAKNELGMPPMKSLTRGQCPQSRVNSEISAILNSQAVADVMLKRLTMATLRNSWLGGFEPPTPDCEEGRLAVRDAGPSNAGRPESHLASYA